MTIGSTIELDRYQRKFILKARNGAMAKVGGEWTEVELVNFTRQHHRDTLAGELRAAIQQVKDPDESALLLYSDETDTGNPLQMYAEVVLICRFYLDTGGYEDFTLFQGFISDPEPEDEAFSVIAYDILWKLTFQFAVFSLEATRITVGGGGAVTLRASSADGEVDPQCLEVNPAAHPEAWWGTRRRSWVPTVASRLLKNGTTMDSSHYLAEPDWGRVTLQVAYEPAATYTLETLSVYQEGTLEAERIIEQALRYPKASFGPGFGDAELQSALTGTFAFTNGSTTVTVAGGAIAEELSPYDRIRLTTETYDKYGVVATVTPPDTIILLYPYPGATGNGAAVKSTLCASTLTVSSLTWLKSSGTVASLIQSMKQNELLPPNYYIWHEPTTGNIVGKLVHMGKQGVEPEVPLPDFEVTARRIIEAQSPRSGEELVTALVVKAEVRQEKSLLDGLAAGAFKLLLTPTVPPPPFWEADAGDENPLNLINGNTKDRYRYWYDYTSGADPEGLPYKDFVQIDLGTPQNLERATAFPGFSKNHFSWYLWLQGSPDDVADPPGPTSWIDLGARARDVRLNPAEWGKGTEFELLAPTPCRYLKVKMQPCKDVRSGGERSCSLAELRIYGSSTYQTEAKITPGVATYPDIQAPQLYDKTYYTVGYVGKLEEGLRVVSAARARKFANLELNELIRVYQRVRGAAPFRPDAMLFDVARITDPWNIHAPNNRLDILIESLTMTPDKVEFEGTHYLAGVLGE